MWLLGCCLFVICGLVVKSGDVRRTPVIAIIILNIAWWLRPEHRPDIAGVHVGKDDFDVGVDDQGIMFGYASDETEDAMPLTHSLPTRLEKKFERRAQEW